MITPAVSIVLPTHNRACVLGRAIRSVLAQTFTDFELLVLDDGSSDNTEQVVSNFNDARIRYIANEHCGSAAIMRNRGIHASRAPLVAFQDSDDEWLVDKLARQVTTLRGAEPETILVCGGYIVNATTAHICYVGADQRMQTGDWTASNLYDFCFIAPTWLARRDALICAGLFDEAMQNLEDWEFAFRLFEHGQMVALNEPLVFKHGGSDSLNYRADPRIASFRRIIEKHASLWSKKPHILARLHAELGLWRCRQGDVKKGRSDLWQAIRLNPLRLRYWSAWTCAFMGPRFYQAVRRLRARKTATP